MLNALFSSANIVYIIRNFHVALSFFPSIMYNIREDLTPAATWCEPPLDKPMGGQNMSFSLSDLNWDQIVQRLMRIFRFDETVWEEIEHDELADMEAAAVVVIAAFLSAVGSGIASRGFIGVFILSLLTGVLISWLLWSFVTMFVGTRLFDAETDFREMARVLGYANAPMALGILSAIPCLGALIGLIAMVLSLVIGFLATREALDLPTGETIITIVIGWVIVFVVTMLIGMGGFLL